MKVLKSSKSGLGSAELVKVLTDHQWLAPQHPNKCLCGWKAAHGEPLKLEAHARHQAEMILGGSNG